MIQGVNIIYRFVTWKIFQREPIEFALLIILISGSCIVEYLIKTGWLLMSM